MLFMQIKHLRIPNWFPLGEDQGKKIEQVATSFKRSEENTSVGPLLSNKTAGTSDFLSFTPWRK